MNNLHPIPPSFPILAPYLEEMRRKYEHDISPINPYGEYFKLRENVYAIWCPCTHDKGDNWAYLDIGSDRALLIDNGYGIGDIKGLAEKLSGKEVITCVTHSHGDHCGGSVQWDTVYAHEACADVLEYYMQDYAGWWNKFNHVGEPVHRRFYEEKDVVPFKPYTVIHMKNHDTISIGQDEEVELIHFGGHAPGNSAFLDRKKRILFGGDCFFATPIHNAGLGCHTDLPRPGVPHPEYMGLRFYAGCVEDFAPRIGEFDVIMPGHAFVECSPEVITDTLQIVRAVLKNPAEHDAEGRSPFGRSYTRSYNNTDVFYNPEEFGL